MPAFHCKELLFGGALGDAAGRGREAPVKFIIHGLVIVEGIY